MKEDLIILKASIINNKIDIDVVIPDDANLNQVIKALAKTIQKILDDEESGLMVQITEKK
jgi:hypothetical protein